jgi:hypothetical protein
MEPRGVVEGECLRELSLPFSVREERPVEALLTPLVLSASLCWALLLRSFECERLWWPGLRTSKAFLRADMAAVVCGGLAVVPSFEISCCWYRTLRSGTEEGTGAES